jgi:luciferase family oxidoreductase group 1
MAALALRGSVDALRADDFPEQVAQLRAFLTDGFPEGHPFRAVQVIPGPGYVPALWLLGSSDFGARLAGMLGLPFGFAHHFAPHGTESGIAAYLESFRPDALDQPYALIGVAVFCAESDTEAAGLARAGALAWARSRTGGDGRVGRVEEAERYEPTLAERHVIEERMAYSVHGPPEAVRTRLDELAARFDVQELMLTTTAYDEEARLRSYELIAEMYDLAGEAA